MGKSTKLGGGGRFEKLKNQIEDEGKSEDSAKAIGRKKYGNSGFAKLAAKGK